MRQVRRLRRGSFPSSGGFSKYSRTNRCRTFIRVDPPTKITSSIPLGSHCASRIARAIGVAIRCIKGLHTFAKAARSILNRFGLTENVPSASGSRTRTASSSASCRLAVSHSARSRATRNGCFSSAISSCVFSLARTAETIRSVKSSPPSMLSPAVARISKVPSKTSITVTSNVPPPRSITHRCFSGITLVKPVNQGGRGRLVDHPANVQTCHFAGQLGRLSLMIVEIRRDRNYGVR